MTREEAIDLLQSRLDLIKKDYPDIADYAEALEMAIESLNLFAGVDKKVSSSWRRENDLVSRQKAIEEIIAQEAIYSDDAVEILKRLPSVQPKIIHCRDCKYGEQDEIGRWYCRGLGCQIGETEVDFVQMQKGEPMDELKPCPFCGRTDSLHIDRYQSDGEWWAYVECTECICTGPVGKLKRNAVDAWNRRAEHESD